MYKPEDLDQESLQQSIDQIDADREERLKAEEEINRQKQAEKMARYAEQQKAIDEGAKAQAKNAKESGLDKLVDTAQGAAGAVMGAKESVMDRGLNTGIARGLNGLFTLPERTFDFATGAMAEEVEQTGSYSPQWDPFREYIDENAPKNWWEMGTQLASQEAVTIGATVATGGATGLSGSMLGRIGLAAGEATLDTEVGQADNLSGSLRWAAENPTKAPKWIQNIYEQVENTMPWLGDGLRNVAINNPLATNEGDDVYTKTLKSVLENMMFEGAGEFLDFLYGGRRLEEIDIDEQVTEQATQQFEVDTGGLPSNTIDVEAMDVTVDPAGGRATLPEGVGTWRASKNPDMADPGQGKYNSRTSPGTQYARRNKQSDAADDMGTSGSAWSANEVENWANGQGIPKDNVNQLAKDLYNSAYYKQNMGSKDWAAANTQAFRRFQKLLGKNVGDMDSKQYWDQLFKELGRDPKQWPIDPVVSDMITADLFSQIRNRGMAALELGEKFDLMDTDGPMQNIAERLALYGNEVEKAKFAMNPDIRRLPRAQRQQAIDEFDTVDYGFYNEKVQEFFQYIKDQPDEDMAKFAAEMFAKQNIHSMPELNNYLRNRFKSETFRGEKGKQALQRELNAMTMLSQLADPETIMRAARGTSEIMGMTSAAKMTGAAMRGDWRMARAAASEFMAFKEVIPDMLQIFKKNADAWWNKDFAQVGNRYKVTLDNDDFAFERFYELQMKEGSLGDKVHARTLKTIRDLNRWQGFSYPFAGLSSVDQVLGVISANQRARNKAFMEMSEGKKPWESIGDKKAFQEARQNYYSAVVDGNGNIDFDSDVFMEAAYKEATLTKPIGGPLKHLDNMVEEYPALGLFYRYANTAVNEIMFDYKSTPIIGAIHKQTLDVQKAIAKDDYTDVMQYGITNRQDALQQRDIILGRSALGLAVTGVFLQQKMDGNLTGNGTLDWKINKGWESYGWKPNTWTVGDLEIDLSEISGIGGMLGLASDIIDNSKFMGKDWSDNALAQVAFSIGAGMANKSMFEPVNNLIRLAKGEEGMWTRMAANMGSSIPGAKWFDKLGEVMLPYQAELTKSLYDQMRNRFKGGELLRSDEDRLQPRVDVLYNDQLSPWDYVENAVNMVTPINMSIRKDRPATDMLLNSGYPTAIISNQHDGIDFSDNRKIRDAYNAELAKFGLGPKLENLMKDSKFKTSYELYQSDLDNNVQVDNPVGHYHHLKAINKLVNKAKDKAWLAVSYRPDVQELVDAKKQNRIDQVRKLYESKQPTVLNMTNK